MTRLPTDGCHSHDDSGGFYPRQPIVYHVCRLACSIYAISACCGTRDVWAACGPWPNTCVAFSQNQTHHARWEARGPLIHLSSARNQPCQPSFRRPTAKTRVGFRESRLQNDSPFFRKKSTGDFSLSDGAQHDLHEGMEFVIAASS